MKYVIQMKLILLVTWATQAFADDSFYGDISYQVQKKNSSANDYSRMVKPCLGVLVQGFSEDHPAVDISGIRNRPLVSMGDGKIKTLFRNQQFGNAIILSLDNGLELLYAHLENYKTDDCLSAIAGFVHWLRPSVDDPYGKSYIRLLLESHGGLCALAQAQRRRPLWKTTNPMIA